MRNDRKSLITIEGAVSRIEPMRKGGHVPVGTFAPATVLSPKAEAFAQMYVAEGNATDAYLQFYDVVAGLPRTTAHRLAHRLRHSATVAARIRELQAAAAQDVVIDLRERMQYLHDVANADAGELTQVITECCRQCHGLGGKPQWIDEAELQRAVERAVASHGTPRPLPMPEFGGFDFNPSRAPSDDCHACHGHGVSRVRITPTDQLSGPARKLFKSARQKADGSIEVELESRAAASEQLARLAGWNIERSESRSVNLNLTADLASDPDSLLAAYNAGRTL
jgi:NAD(P)-dependent dehydrogenase (short-subunit alcohol dehydrogenase family)